MTHTLVIDTSYGSTVGLVGHRPIIETDSRTHVERLQVNIAKACEQAGIQPSDLTRIIVGTGPGPFTGLRAGIVTAKALAFATGAQLDRKSTCQNSSHRASPPRYHTQQ